MRIVIARDNRIERNMHYGGGWGGERVNWAHLLAMWGNAIGYGGTAKFADF
jgi:hypothetical protein